MEWQPIETAPRDGTQFLAVSEMPEMMVARWFESTDGSAFWVVFYNDNGVLTHPYPLTHWMPLPTPPETDNGEKG